MCTCARGRGARVGARVHVAGQMRPDTNPTQTLPDSHAARTPPLSPKTAHAARLQLQRASSPPTGGPRAQHPCPLRFLACSLRASSPSHSRSASGTAPAGPGPSPPCECACAALPYAYRASASCRAAAYMSAPAAASAASPSGSCRRAGAAGSLIARRGVAGACSRRPAPRAEPRPLALAGGGARLARAAAPRRAVRPHLCERGTSGRPPLNGCPVPAAYATRRLPRKWQNPDCQSRAPHLCERVGLPRVPVQPPRRVAAVPQQRHCARARAFGRVTFDRPGRFPLPGFVGWARPAGRTLRGAA